MINDKIQMLEISGRESKTLGSVLIILFTILWIRWRRKKLKVFEELGIPGPPPHFFTGNLSEINKQGLLQCQQKWVKKYGKIVGYFHGLKPVLMIADEEILKNIFIKDFHLFSDRPEIIPLRIHSFLDHIIPASQIMDSLLPNLKGENWKRVRSKLSPIFSANKLKMMISFVDKVTDVTLSILEEKAYRCETIDIYHLLQRLTLDIISAQAFAIHTDIQNEGMNNSLFRSAKTILDNPTKSKILTFGLCFPELGILGMTMNLLKMFFSNGCSIPPLKITSLVGKVIEQRRKYPDTRQPDLLQGLIDASDIETENPSNTKVNVSGTAARDGRKTNASSLKAKQEGLTDTEIKANALVVFLAGYETTSSALAYTIYMLAKYPKYQEEIQQEIDRCVESKELDYYVLNELQLMERFMLETLRFYPPALGFILREATADVEYGYLRVPKGMQVTVPVTYMHFSEDNWENPEMFDPGRFLPENKKPNHVTSYWAFGIGPRMCIGTRLANITSKVVLIKLLKRFSFELPDNPEEAKLILTLKTGGMVPCKVTVKVKRRFHLQEK